MKTTWDTISEIEERLSVQRDDADTGTNYAVLYFDPLNDEYEGVDWLKVSDYFKTEEIHGYTMTRKRIITVDINWKSLAVKFKFPSK